MSRNGRGKCLYLQKFIFKTKTERKQDYEKDGCLAAHNNHYFWFNGTWREDICGLWIPFDEEGTLFIKQDDFSGQFILVDINGEEADDHSFRAYQDSNYKNILHIFYDDVNGYLDVSGRWIAKPQFEYAGSFRENGLAVVGKDRLWGLINLNGEYVFEPQFEQNYKYSMNYRLMGKG